MLTIIMIIIIIIQFSLFFIGELPQVEVTIFQFPLYSFKVILGCYDIESLTNQQA